MNQGKPLEDKFVLGEAGFVKGFEDNIIGMRADEEKEFPAKFPENSAKKDWAGKEAGFRVKMKLVQKMDLPEISDEFAKGLGNFDSLTALRESIKQGITMEKQEAEKQRKRKEILDKILERINFEVPEKLVEYEKNKVLDDLKQKITQGLKISFEDYLSSIKQTEEQLKGAFQKEAEKRIKNFLILREIGKREDIEVSDTEVEQEVNKIIKNWSPETLRQTQAGFDIEKLKEYTKGVLYNEKVFQKLESYITKN
jgi:trigger factor